MQQEKLYKTFKQCGTCSLWTGVRTPVPSGHSVFDKNQKGKCCGGGFPNGNMSYNDGCLKWDLWAPLRK